MNEKSRMLLDPITKKNVDLWLNGAYDKKTKQEIRKLLNENPKEIIDSFYTHLSFGTGGLRGIMGIGCNRMNYYTVCAATQGLANYLNQQPACQQKHCVLIGYDSRHLSREFALECARVLAGNGIRALIFKELRPTPLISFGCRFKACQAAIMITASHNPPEYNGYKVYWNDGGQILPPHDTNILAEIEKVTNPLLVKKSLSSDDPFIEWVGEEIDKAYLETIRSLQNHPKDNASQGNTLKVVYTSLHGTGITMVPKALNEWGFTNLAFVRDQVIPNGNFPTVVNPNPEEKTALKLGIETLVESQGDLLIVTDPDCDRIGIAIRDKDEVYIFNGNQIACVCLSYLCEALSSQNKMPHNAAFIKTVATTELFKAICENYQRPCFNVLTGFKYIAQKINQWEQNSEEFQFIFGAEESFGYLLGTQTRDKDAIVVSALICEIALQAKMKSQSLLNFLQHIYLKHGYYYEMQLSLKFEESREGRELMQRSIKKVQTEYPKDICGVPVHYIEDYYLLIKKDLVSGRTEKIDLPSTKMLIFWLADKSKLVIRPSGTEPKIKIYCGVVLENFDSLVEAEIKGEKYARMLLNDLQQQLQNRQILNL
jgi:phosphomannomutase